MNKKNKIISELERLLTIKSKVTRESSLSFASTTLDLIGIANGKESSTYLTMKSLLYDDTPSRLLGEINSTNDVILYRINMDNSFDNIIKDSISKIKTFGLYKPPKTYNNFLGKFSDFEMYSFIIGLFALSFFLGHVFGTFFFGIPSTLKKQGESIMQSELNSKKITDQIDTDTTQTKTQTPEP